MKLNKENIESYLIDLQDAKLSDVEAAEVFAFLEQHPELSHLWDSLLNDTNDVSSFSFLKKQLEEEDVIAYMEGVLMPNRSSWVENEIKNNPTLEKELALYRQTISKPDATVVFEHKHSLYKEAKVVPLPFANRAIYWAAAAAAIVFVSVFLFNKGSKQEAALLSQAGNYKKSNTLQTKINPQTKAEVFTIDAKSKSNEEQIKRATNQKVNKPEAIKNLVSQDSAWSLPTENVQNIAVVNDQEKVDALKQIQLPIDVLTTKPAEEKVAYYPVEADDLEPVKQVSTKKEKNFWSMTSGVLKNLRVFGAKKVQVEEKPKDDKTQYTFVLGNFSVTKTK